MVEIVCNGLQSCLESAVVDSRMHSLALHSPKLLTPHQPIHIPTNHCHENIYTINHSNPSNSNNNNNKQNGWSFLEAVSNVCKDKESGSAYIHPQVKYSYVTLSPKSLELCTENLGNETGSDEMMDNEVKLTSSSLWECGERIEKKKAIQYLRGCKEKRNNLLPPPLTSMRDGSDSLKMIPRRECGRLVIEVTKIQPSVSCFQAQRIHGRLLLSFLEEDEDEGFQEDVIEKEMMGEIEDLEGEEETELEWHEYENENENENSWNIRGGIRIMEKYDRRRRRRRRCNCKENDDYENNGFGIGAVNVLTA